MERYFDIEHSKTNGSFPFEKLEECGIKTVLLQDRGMKQTIRISIFIDPDGEEDATENYMLYTAYLIGSLVEVFRGR